VLFSLIGPSQSRNNIATLL